MPESFSIENSNSVNHAGGLKSTLIGVARSIVHEMPHPIQVAIYRISHGIPLSSYFASVEIPGLELNATFFINSETTRFRSEMFGGELEFLIDFLSVIHEDDTVYDIGSSIGLYTIFAAEMAEKGVVYAFDPDRYTNNILRKNISRNNLTNVILLPYAVSDSVGTTVLFQDPQRRLSSCLSNIKNLSRDGMVPKFSLDSLIMINAIRPPTVMKIDIEGSELLALRGAHDLFHSEAKPRHVFIEIHGDEFAPTNNYENVMDFMLRNGYRLIKGIIRDGQHLKHFERI